MARWSGRQAALSGRPHSDRAKYHRVGAAFSHRLLSGDEFLKTIEANQLHSVAQLALGVQAAGMNMGFMLLGLGSAVFAYLLLPSRYVPRVLAGWGVFSSLLLATYALSITVFPKAVALQLAPMLPMGIYEVTLGFWLLLRGARIKSSSMRASHQPVVGDRNG